MIGLVCPACKKHSSKVITTLVIRSLGYMTIVPSRNTGVERAISSPTRAESGQPKVKIIPDSNLTCERCDGESPAARWKYVVSCDSCGSLITSREVKNPSGIVNERVCRDTLSIYCNKCWSRSNQDYCPDCRFSETCILYNNG